MVCTTSDKQISRTFQGQILQFSRTTICSINMHSLSPIWTPYWLKYLMEPWWWHFLILISITTLCKMAPVTGYNLQLHLRYRNSIWNKEKEIKQCSCRKMFLCYSRVLQVISPRMSQIFLGEKYNFTETGVE